jgi:hypothetical protein
MYWCAAPEISCGYAERDRWVLRRAAALVPLAPSLAIRNREAPGEIFCHQHSAGPWQSLRSFLNNNKKDQQKTTRHTPSIEFSALPCHPAPSSVWPLPPSLVPTSQVRRTVKHNDVTIITCSIALVQTVIWQAHARSRAISLLHEHPLVVGANVPPKLTDGEAGRVAPCVWCLAESPWQRLQNTRDI